jgi:hypothetical protein
MGLGCLRDWWRDRAAAPSGRGERGNFGRDLGAVHPVLVPDVGCAIPVTPSHGLNKLYLVGMRVL